MPLFVADHRGGVHLHGVVVFGPAVVLRIDLYWRRRKRGVRIPLGLRWRRIPGLEPLGLVGPVKRGHQVGFMLFDFVFHLHQL
ncbi:hypothetical protein D3C71_1816630 [compost metagenome]